MTILVPKIVNSIGLLFDIAGAWLVAWEVVKQFKQCQYNPQLFDDIGNQLEKNPNFEKWEKNKFKKMRLGLALLTFGFLFQLASNWL